MQCNDNKQQRDDSEAENIIYKERNLKKDENIPAQMP